MVEDEDEGRGIVDSGWHWVDNLTVDQILYLILRCRAFDLYFDQGLDPCCSKEELNQALWSMGVQKSTVVVVIRFIGHRFFLWKPAFSHVHVCPWPRKSNPINSLIRDL